MRIVRSGAAKQGALLREKDIQSLRAEIERHVARERELESALTQLRDQLLAAEQQREDAQRALYLAHRGVSELAGQLQSQQGRLDSARARIERIDVELEHQGRRLYDPLDRVWLGPPPAHAAALAQRMRSVAGQIADARKQPF